MSDGDDDLTVIIMAGGLGTRFTGGHKVLYPIYGEPMLVHLIRNVCKIRPKPAQIIVVVNPAMKSEIIENLRPFIQKTIHKITWVEQSRPRGTGDAIRCCIPLLHPRSNVLILSGDTPMLHYSTMNSIVNTTMERAMDATVLVRYTRTPVGYGRVLLDSENGTVERIVEERDATDAERVVQLVNTGIYCIRARALIDFLPWLTADNAQREFYLTDIFGIMRTQGSYTGIYEIPEERAYETIGVNTMEDLYGLLRTLKDKI